MALRTVAADLLEVILLFRPSPPLAAVGVDLIIAVAEKRVLPVLAAVPVAEGQRVTVQPDQVTFLQFPRPKEITAAVLGVRPDFLAGAAAVLVKLVTQTGTVKAEMEQPRLLLEVR